MNFIDFKVEEQCIKSITILHKSLTVETKTDILGWNTFELLTGKHIDLKKRIWKRIRVFREGGNIYVSDHEWILNEKYKRNGIHAQVEYINAEGEALLSNLVCRLNVITSIQPLDWKIL